VILLVVSRGRIWVVTWDEVKEFGTVERLVVLQECELVETLDGGMVEKLVVC